MDSNSVLVVEMSLVFRFIMIALGVVLFVLIKRILKFLAVSRHDQTIRCETEQSIDIQTELLEFRVLADADRVSVTRFHNGNIFLPSHPVWRLSRTHEVSRRGVEYETAKLQGVLVSLIPNIVGSLLTGSSNIPGISGNPCNECPSRIKCLKENKRVVIFQVDELENSYCKYFFEKQNIKTAIICGLSSSGVVFGFIEVDFTNIKRTPEQVKDISKRVCVVADKVLYYINSGRNLKKKMTLI